MTNRGWRPRKRKAEFIQKYSLRCGAIISSRRPNILEPARASPRLQYFSLFTSARAISAAGKIHPIPAVAPGYMNGSPNRQENPMRHEIIPNLRYADAPRAIEFLCEAFGFEKRAVY